MKTVALASRDPVLIGIIDNALKGLYGMVHLSSMQSIFDYVYDSIPNLLIVDIQKDDEETIVRLNELKDDPLFKQLPVIACVPDEMPMPDWNALFVEDYVRKCRLEQEIVERVNISIIRSERIGEINPLTRLPGNISINRQVQERLDRGEPFALAYTDIDYFKPFNDKYGFNRGDEVIRITGRLITNIVKNKQPQEGFVGHIGGDDFIFIMQPDLIEAAAQDIITSFDSIALTLYDAEDLKKGCIESVDRQGKKNIFPFVTISIGITDTVSKKFDHFGAVAEAASEMKHYAKQSKASCYRWDRRTGN